MTVTPDLIRTIPTPDALRADLFAVIAVVHRLNALLDLAEDVHATPTTPTTTTDAAPADLEVSRG